MSGRRFPLTYDECRHLFRHLAARAGATLEARPIEARGPWGQVLTLDVARLGATPAARVLVTMSGTHGIEGFAGSVIQQRLLAETAPTLSLPRDAALLLIHAVNPWGFAWWRRQNESNVDLNRNWVEHGRHGLENPGYGELHPWLCPETLDEESERLFLEAADRFIRERGYAWVKEAVTRGQYEFPDGLYYGGAAEEVSVTLLRDVFARHVAPADEALCIDLHTGHGEFGTYTLLSNHARGSAAHAWLERLFDPAHLEVTRGNPDAVTPDKAGQLARGVAEVLPGVEYRSITFELGTVDDIRMIQAERREHWLHLHGERESPRGRSISWEHRICSIPDSPAWESLVLSHAERVLGDALGWLRGAGTR